MTFEKILSNIWFTVRWYTGFLIEITITAGAITAMFWSFFHYISNPLSGIPIIPDSWLSNPFVSFSVALGVFAAFMSGRQWVRTQYFTHILPEVWSDTVKNFLRKAAEEKDDEEDT